MISVMRSLLLLILFGLVQQIQSWCLRTTLSQNFQIAQVDWAADNSIFVTANKGEKVIRIYDARTFQLLKIYNHSNQQPKSIKISKNSLYIGIAYKNSDLRVVRATSPFAQYMQFDTFQTDIAQVDFSYDNNYVLTCGDDQGIKTWNLSAPSSTTPIIDQRLTPNPSDAVACRYGPNGDIAYSDDNRRVKMYMSGGSVIELGRWGDDTSQIDFKPASSTIGTVSKDKIFRFNTTVMYTDTAGNINTVSIGKQGKYYAFAGISKILRIYDQATNTLVAKFIGFKNVLNSIKFSKDQNYLITADVSGQIRVYSTTCGMFSCQSGEYNASGVCKKCSTVMSFCISCKSASACQVCMAGYFKSGVGCAACYTTLNYCLECSDGTLCLKCLDGYYLDSTTKKCVKCSLKGCIQCNNSAICTKCFKLDFYLDTTLNTCKQCVDTLTNCIRCYNSTVCVDCQIGFYEDPTTKACIQCPGNCLACQTSTNCTQCKTGYWASGGSCVRCTTAQCISCNQTGICYDCKQGTFLTGTNTCTICTNPCATCSITATNCTGCIIGYYFDTPNFKCLKCIENCKVCNESIKCLSCFPGFKVDGTTFTCKHCSGYYGNCSECSSTQCLKCREGFWADTTASYICKTCVSVIPNCMNCANSTNCIQCITSYYPTGLTGTLSCAACSTGCQQCILAGNCTNCFPTFFKNTSLLCEPCKNKCFQCTSEFICTSCVVGYYLDVSTCKACQIVLAYCSQCIDSITCITCLPGAYFDSADNKCKLCALSNCLTCNKTDCYSCQVGYYLDISGTPFSCKKCGQFCQQCSSGTVCSSCIDGYYYDSVDFKCKSCSLAFPHCTLCNKTYCLQCDQGMQLNTTNSNQCSSCSNYITNCKICFWDNSIATPIVKCNLCNYGFGLASNNLTCPSCNYIYGCIQCKSASSCIKCEIGFYLKADNTCGLCKQNCLTCNNALTCISCRQGYVNDSTNCVLCQTKIDGCSKCLVNTVSTFNCTYCQIGYYLKTIDAKCYICHETISGCYTCNDSSTCTACLDKYFLDTTTPTHICKKCVTNIPGCQLCNSSSICLSCQDSYYLDIGTNKCYFCSNNLPGCLHCKDNTICSQCESGYYLTVGNICGLCESVLQGCIYCNSQIYCIQCRSGYYLNTGDNKCYKCAQPGCEVCSQSSSITCVTCNSKYYMVGSSCNTCRSRVTYCDQCNTTQCLSCQVGYYLSSPTICSTCSSSISGCSRCSDNLNCLQCMSSYFVNSTSKCQQCNKVMFGCQNCINGSVCISCEANYFLNSTTDICQPCTDINGCMLCKNQTTCVMCQQKYYMQSSQCLVCSQALKGCFSCVSSTVCIQCVSGYVLDTTTYKCSVNTVQAKQKVQGLKLVSYYVSQSMLKHVLYAKGTTFKKIDSLNITSNGKTALFSQDYTGKQIQLNILSYQYGASGNSVIFYTDNPLASQIQSKTKQMTFRRLLGESQLNLQVMVKMNQDVYHQILPDLDYSGSMTVGYSLNNPQFVNSYMTAQSGNKYFMYEIFGICVIVLFLINYVIKFLCTMPQSKNRSTLLPHIIALKSCCLIMYPAHFEYINFCKGFMVVDIPWLNSYIAASITDLSDFVQLPFGLFYDNMSIAGTFFLGLGVYIGLILIIQTYFYMTNQQSKQQKGSQKSSQLSSDEELKKYKQFKIQKLQQAIGINYDNDQSQTNKSVLNKRNFLQLLWNIFTFSMVYYACLSVQGAFYNYLQVITVNGIFYIIGMLMFIYVTIQTFYSFARNFKAINKVRIYIKACLLSLAHFNPIYIVSVCVTFDMLLAIMQFYLINKKNQFSKFFVLTHILSSLCIALMIFVSQSLVSLFVTAISLIICFGFEIYIHAKEYQNANKKLGDQQFKMDEDDEKVQEEDDHSVNRSYNVWDLGKKALSPNRKPKGFKDIDMYATMQAFDKQNTFDMQNVQMDLHRSPNRSPNRRPQTAVSQLSQPVVVKQGGRRNKQRKTQQAFRSNIIEIIPKPTVQNKQRQKGMNKFSLQELDSSSS